MGYYCAGFYVIGRPRGAKEETFEHKQSWPLGLHERTVFLSGFISASRGECFVTVCALEEALDRSLFSCLSENHLLGEQSQSNKVACVR